MKYTELSLTENMQKTLEKIGFTNATPIQQKAIPLGLEGKDIIGQAQTGTGKTAGFSIPIIEQMKENKQLQTLILVPTRELALQVADAFKQLAQHTNLRVAVVFGGAPIEKQIRELKNGYECVVATPGRCIDLMKRRILKPQNIKFLVLDEVDEMLSMGFIDDVETIASQLEDEKQTLFFSATMNKNIERVAEKFLKDPVRITIQATRETLDQIEQSYVVVREGQKMSVLTNMLRVQNPERAIIFAKTKKRVDEIAENLAMHGFNVERIHGDLSQEQRTFTFKKFRLGQTNILIATDVAARGLDIKELSHVYNFDLPQELEYYIHRIGRTGRAEAKGEAISFMTPRELDKFLPLVERKTKTKLQKLKAPALEEILEAIEKKAENAMLNNIQEAIDKGYYENAKRLIKSENIDPALLVASALNLLNKGFDKEKFIEEFKRNIRKGQVHAGEKRHDDRRRQDRGNFRHGQKRQGDGRGDGRSRNRRGNDDFQERKFGKKSYKDR